VIVGLTLVLVGVNTTMWLGAAGFAIMVAAVAFALTPPRRRARLGVIQSDGTVRRPSSAPRGTSRPKTSGSFMHRLEERWDRRRDQY
jgi:hypothetical protein